MFVQEFLNYINNNEYNLSFKGMWDNMEVNFLHITQTGSNENYKDVTSLYGKPTSGISIVKANSYNSRHMVLAVSIGEYTGTRKAWTREEDFLQEKATINNKLLAQGCKTRMLRDMAK